MTRTKWTELRDSRLAAFTDEERAEYDRAYRAASEGKRTALKAGHHTLEVNVGPGGAVLEPVLLAGARGDTVTMIKKRVDEVFASADRGVYPPGSGAKLAKSLIWASGDLQAVRKIYIGIDVKPGFYFFAAIDTTAAKLPDPLQEQVAITVT